MHVSLGKVDELSLGLTGGDDVTPVVLHSLSSLSLDFSGNDDLSTLGNTGSLDLQDVFSFGDSDSDFSSEVADLDFDSLVSELSEDLGEELMKLGLEDSVGNELSLDCDLSGFVLLHF